MVRELFQYFERQCTSFKMLTGEYSSQVYFLNATVEVETSIGSQPADVNTNECWR